MLLLLRRLCSIDLKSAAFLCRHVVEWNRFYCCCCCCCAVNLNKLLCIHSMAGRAGGSRQSLQFSSFDKTHNFITFARFQEKEPKLSQNLIMHVYFDQFTTCYQFVRFLFIFYVDEKKKKCRWKERRKDVHASKWTHQDKVITFKWMKKSKRRAKWQLNNFILATTINEIESVFFDKSRRKLIIK